MKLRKLTTEEILNNDVRLYNSKEWEKRINSILKFKNVQFYIEPKEESNWDYDRFFAVYEIPEGIRLFNEVSYSSCLTSAGFISVHIDSTGNVLKIYPKNGNGENCSLANCSQNRRFMAKNSQAYQTIYTNIF